MSKIYKKQIEMLPLFGISLYIYYCIVQQNVLLADDLSKVFQGLVNKETFFNFIIEFISGTNMTSRPISAFVTGTFIYLVKFDVRLYYLLFIFYIVSVFFVKNAFISLTKSNTISEISTLLYFLVPIGTSIWLSPIMVNSSIATIFFCSSILFFQKKTINSLFLSIIFFFLSFLSYEIFAPCIILFIIVKEISWKKKLIFIFSCLVLIFAYKKIFEPYLFTNFHKRESISSILDFNKNAENIVFIIKMLFRDLPISIFKSILNIKYYNLFDYCILIFFNTITIKYLKIPSEKKRKEMLFIAGICLISALLIFFVSNYKPTLFGFDNRNLGAVKFFFSIFFVLTLLKIFNLFKLERKTIKLFFSITIILASISAISIKNAWIYANNFNKHLFSELEKSLPKNLKASKILIKYDLEIPKNDPHFILREQIYYYPWESRLLLNNIKKHNIQVQLFTNKFNDIHYIYDYDKKTLTLINLKKKLKSL